MSKSKLDLLQGTLDLLILKTLALGPMHGWGISQRIQQISEDVLRVNQGSLYPALHRLESAGWIDAEWGASENNRQAKFYRLTKTGSAAAARRDRAVGAHGRRRGAHSVGRGSSEARLQSVAHVCAATLARSGARSGGSTVEVVTCGSESGTKVARCAMARAWIASSTPKCAFTSRWNAEATSARA